MFKKASWFVVHVIMLPFHGEKRKNGNQTSTTSPTKNSPTQNNTKAKHHRVKEQKKSTFTVPFLRHGKSMCLSGRLPFSNCSVSSLAAGFRFHLYSMCIALSRNFNIGCCANEKLLRLIAHRRVRFFTFMFVSTLVLGAGGELVESNSSFGKCCDPGDSRCTSSVST